MQRIHKNGSEKHDTKTPFFIKTFIFLKFLLKEDYKPRIYLSLPSPPKSKHKLLNRKSSTPRKRSEYSASEETEVNNIMIILLLRF